MSTRWVAVVLGLALLAAGCAGGSRAPGRGRGRQAADIAVRVGERACADLVAWIIGRGPRLVAGNDLVASEFASSGRAGTDDHGEATALCHAKACSATTPTARRRPRGPRRRRPQTEPVSRAGAERARRDPVQVTPGGTVDVLLSLRTTDLDQQRCSLIHVITPDSPKIAPSEVRAAEPSTIRPSPWSTVSTASGSPARHSPARSRTETGILAGRRRAGALRRLGVPGRPRLDLDHRRAQGRDGRVVARLRGHAVGADVLDRSDVPCRRDVQLDGRRGARLIPRPGDVLRHGRRRPRQEVARRRPAGQRARGRDHRHRLRQQFCESRPDLRDPLDGRPASVRDDAPAGRTAHSCSSSFEADWREGPAWHSSAGGGYTRSPLWGGDRARNERQEGSVAQAAPKPRRRRRRRRRHPRRRAVARPTSPTARPRADAPHRRDPDPARPELLGPRAGRPDGRRPRRPRGVPVATRSRASPTPSSTSCRASRTTPAASAGAAASSRGSRKARGPATSPSTSRSSSRTSPAPTSATARPASTGEYGRYNVIYEYREEAVGIEAGKIAVALVNHLVAPTDPDHQLDFMAELERLIRLAERQAFGPQHAGDPRRGREPRHPVHPPRPPLARPARPGRPPAADPGDDDVDDVGHRGRHRERQEPDEPPPRLGRPAGPEERRRRRPRTQAADAANRIGYPCVVKPLDGNHGRGVHLDLRDEEAGPQGVPRSPAPRAAAATSSSRATSPATTTAAS